MVRLAGIGPYNFFDRPALKQGLVRGKQPDATLAPHQICEINCALDRVRTCDLKLRKLALYPTELREQILVRGPLS